MFCAACQNVLKTVAGFDGVQVEHLSFDEISTSRHVCAMCAQLWRGDGPERTLFRESALSTTTSNPQATQSGRLLLYVFFNGSTFTIRRGDESVKYYVRGSSKTPEMKNYRSEQLNFINSSPTISAVGLDAWRAYLPRIKELLKQCDSGHKNCDTLSRPAYWFQKQLGQLHPRSKQRLPKRLIQFSAPLSTIRLRESRKLRIATRYMTLSHRWCNEPGIQLTKASYDAFVAGIDVGKIRRTFSEAMQVCLDLGIQYIWIDSLCILQDSDDSSDWRDQARSMHLVYANTYLNLCADATEDGSWGLFPSWSRATVDQLWHEDSKGRMWVPSVNQCNFARSMTYSPLASRGWVVQEMFFTPRTLHFTYLQLSWRCRGGTWSSGNPNEGGSAMQTGLHGLKSTLDGIDLDQLTSNWRELVQTYSSSNLTYATDKLAAYEGIAQAFIAAMDKKSRGNLYIAGLWKDSIHHELLWYCAKGFRGGPNLFRGPHSTESSAKTARGSSFVAPSWSWLSVDTMLDWVHLQNIHPLYFLAKETQPCAEVVDVKQSSANFIVHGLIVLQAEFFNVEVIAGHSHTIECGREEDLIVYFYDGEDVVPPDGMYTCLVVLQDTLDPLIKQGILMREARQEEIKEAATSLPIEEHCAYYVRCGVWFTASTDAHCAHEGIEPQGALRGFINKDILESLYTCKVKKGEFHVI